MAVQPETQTVEWIFACVTAGLVAPGVRDRFGKIAPAPLTTIPSEPPPGWLAERFGAARVLDGGGTAAGVAVSTGADASDGGAAAD